MPMEFQKITMCFIHVLSGSNLANEIPVFYMRTFWSREYIGIESYSSDLDTYVGTTCE